MYRFFFHVTVSTYVFCFILPFTYFFHVLSTWLFQPYLFMFVHVTVVCSWIMWFFILLLFFFTLLSLDLASIFLSIPSSPSFLMNDSDVFLPEASGKMCPRSIYHLRGELVVENFKAFVNSCFCHRIYVFVQNFSVCVNVLNPSHNSWCNWQIRYILMRVMFIAPVNHVAPFSWDGATAGALTSPGGGPTIQRCLIVLLVRILSLGLARQPFPSTQAHTGEGPERASHPAERAGWPHQKPGRRRQPSEERRCLLLRVLVAEPVDRLQWSLCSSPPPGPRVEGDPEASVRLGKVGSVPLRWLCGHLLQSGGQLRGQRPLFPRCLLWYSRQSNGSCATKSNIKW